MDDKILLGGQAVIEGVMIKSPKYISVSCRNDKGVIVNMHEKLKPIKFKFLKWPFIRGFINLFQMLIIGIKALIWSANQSSDEQENLSKTELAFTLGFSIFISVLFFVALPYALTNWIGIIEESQPIFFNFIDGLIKIALFVGYVYAISFMKDVKRLFQYHGAEHQAVYCHEAEKELTPENLKKFPTMHPRCGTSFIMLVFVTSILIFSVLPSFVSFISPTFFNQGFWYQKGILLFLRILFIPFIAGTAYELLRISAKYKKNPFFKLIILPGIWLQYLTTKDADDKQMEVAIHSLKQAISLEKS